MFLERLFSAIQSVNVEKLSGSYMFLKVLTLSLK